MNEWMNEWMNVKKDIQVLAYVYHFYFHSQGYTAYSTSTKKLDAAILKYLQFKC